METNENLNNALTEPGSQINLVVSQPDSDETTIDLGKVFRRMKLSFRLFVWVVVFCIVLGACAPLLLYQIRKSPTRVYSAVTLAYEIRSGRTSVPVTDLTAPDGTELDLSQITSAYVLQNALNRVTLSEPVSLTELRANITIQRILTDESMRQQEILSAMEENKNNGIYEQMASIEYQYKNSFVVSLRNGFGEEDERRKTEIPESELSLLLNSILDSYNDYLAETYADVNLPGDTISVVDINELDIPVSVDQLRSGLQTLYSYCDGKSDRVKAYRSHETGLSLNDLMRNIRLIQNIDVDYLSSYVYANGIARDRDEVIDNHRYNLLVAKTELEEIRENIAAVTKLLENYKNDEILISVPESDGTQTAVTNTAYYNRLVEQQAANEQLAAEKEEEIIELETRIAALQNAGGAASKTRLEEAEAELSRLAEKCNEINTMVREHMEEIFESSFYNNMAEHSAAMSSEKGFLAANWKRMVLGIAAGVFIGVVIWFAAALLPEFSGKHEVPAPADSEDSREKEVSEA